MVQGCQVAANKLYLVTKEDTVLQATSYLVRAYDEDHARSLVDGGMYIEETATATMDTLETKTVDVTEINEYGKGQER